MAKPIRNVSVDTDHWAEWQRHLKSIDYRTPTWNEIDRIAAERGVDRAEVHAEVMKEYEEIRAAFDAEMQATQEIRQQALMLRNNSLDSTCAVYQRADRILTGSLVNVQVSELGGTSIPAWNDGSTVTLNSAAIKQIDEETITSLHGLNYHEMAHLLYTPRVGSELGKWVQENKLHSAYNILEDGRAEHLLTTKYPSVRPFLIATVGDYLIDNPMALSKSFVLLAARRYYSLSARQVSARMYADEFGIEQAKTVYNLSNEYRSLVFPRDYARAREIIEAFAEFAKDVETPGGCSGRPVMRNGRPESGKAQEALQNESASEYGDENLFDKPNTPNDGAGNSGDDNGSTEDKGWDSTGKDASLLEQLQESVDRAKSDKQLQDKVRETQKAIKSNESTKTLLARQARSTFPANNAEIVSSRLFSQELERLRIDADPAWNMEKPTGKLNVRRAMQADVNDINKLFDRWETGNDNYEIEACILIDRSGSMAYDIGAACRAAWVIKRAVERINGSVTVLTFNETSRLLYSSDERAGTEPALVNATGGTNPYYALLETERVMLQSRKPTKLVFMLTDGEFYSGESDPVIDRLNKMGCNTNLVYLATNEYTQRWLANRGSHMGDITHGAQNFRVITSPTDLIKVAKDVVRFHLRKAA